MGPAKDHLALEAEFRHQLLEALLVGTATHDQRGRRINGALRGERRQENIDTLELTQLADEDEVRGVLVERRLVELMRVEAVRHDADGAGWPPDRLRVTARGEVALEDDAVGHGRQPPLEPHVYAPHEGIRRIVQAAAMRRVEGGDPLLALQAPCREPRIGAALGAMSVQDIGPQLSR